MKFHSWTQSLRSLYDKAISLYQRGHHDLTSYFTPGEQTFLSSIGLKPINVYDFAEDWIASGEPDWDTFLLIAAARRDYFLHQQKGTTSAEELNSNDLPARKDTLDRIAWLPRIIVKARCFLEGTLCHDVMYCCGGDRHFLNSHGIHPADFLRVVWAAKDDDQKILAFVESSRSTSTFPPPPSGRSADQPAR
jgi:hypothetical protein